jgi:uncharacterized membrane protein YgcG
MRDDVAWVRRRQKAGAATIAIAAVVAFASLGGIGLAKSSIALAQYQYGKKVTICHKGKNTITISLKAWPAHQHHGDTLGKCANGHKTNKGKHKGESHHAPNPGTGTGDTNQSGQSSSSHGNGNGGGNGNGKGKGHS